MKFKKYSGPLALAAVCGLLLCSCKGKQEQAPEQTPELAVLTVGAEDASLETGYPATLHGMNDVEIRPQVSGFITKVCVEEGQHVSKGQVLFMIDRVQLEAAVSAAESQIQQASAQISQANAAVAAAQANVNTARTNANNNKILLDRNIISASAYQTSVDAVNAAVAQVNQAKASVNAAQAARAAAQAQLVTAKKNLSFSNVTAPASGIVGTIDYKEGALVSPSTLLTILSNNGEIEAYFSLTEKELLEMTDNGARTIEQAISQMPDVFLRLSNGEKYPYPGRIVSVSGVLDSATGSATAKALFPNPNGFLRSGNTANVIIPKVNNDVIMIPQKATYEIQDMKFVYTLDKNNVTHSTPIKVSKLDDGQNYIVTDGLKAGDRIVVEGVGISVKDKMPIRPKKGGAAQTQNAAPQMPQ